MKPLLATVALLLAAPAAWAHKPSDAYLTLRVAGPTVEGRWDLALRDLEHAIGLDADGDGAIAWGELRSRETYLAGWALAALRLAGGGGPCEAVPRGIEAVRHSDGSYAVLRFLARCPAEPEALDVSYALLFDLDPQHRGLLKLEAGGRVQTAVFSSGQRERRLALSGGGTLSQLVELCREGVWHIWIGFDHVLFLLALLIPAVLRREGRRWRPAADLRAVLGDVVRIVTAFTLAHSATLALAATGVVAVSSRWVEAAIAASVIAAALNNLFPVFHSQRWVVAFALGLLHGFGFSGALADLGLARESLALSLLGFNLGVELGQLAIVGAFLPLAYLVRRSWAYQRLALVGGSTAVVVLAAVWMVERAFALEIL